MRLFRTLGQKSGVRNHSTLDITRLSMERYLQEIIENKNVLEGQEMPLKRFLKSKGATTEIVASITQSLHIFFINIKITMSNMTAM